MFTICDKKRRHQAFGRIWDLKNHLGINAFNKKVPSGTHIAEKFSFVWTEGHDATHQGCFALYQWYGNQRLYPELLSYEEEFPFPSS